MLDLAVRSSIKRRTLVVLSAVVGPFAAFIDGRYVIGIITSDLSVLLVLAIPTVIGGLLGGFLFARLSPRLSMATEFSRPGLKTMIPVASLDLDTERTRSN
jgi:high-affinity K+ transport system ATPase subunit B